MQEGCLTADALTFFPRDLFLWKDYQLIALAVDRFNHESGTSEFRKVFSESGSECVYTRVFLRIELCTMPFRQVVLCQIGMLIIFLIERFK